MKKYYFYPRIRSFAYLFIGLALIGYGSVIFFADYIYPFHIFCIAVFYVSAVIVLCWFAFSLSSRIQIDYEKEELYIITFYFIKRIKFEDITCIRVIDYKEVKGVRPGLEIYIVTRKFFRMIPYARYIDHRKATPEIKLKLDELENDLMRINNKEYKIVKTQIVDTTIPVLKNKQ